MLASPSASTIASRLDAEYSVAPSPKPMSAQSPPSAASSHTVLCVSVAIELDALTYGQMHVVSRWGIASDASASCQRLYRFDTGNSQSWCRSDVKNFIMLK